MSTDFQISDFVHFQMRDGRDVYGYIQCNNPEGYVVEDLAGDYWGVTPSNLTLVLRTGACDAGADEYDTIMELQEIYPEL